MTNDNFIAGADWNTWQRQVDNLLQSNRVEVGSYRFTRPAPMVYEHQWLWDSAFHAIIARWFDPALAGDELKSIVAHQLTAGPDEGMIPHMAYWQGGGNELWGIEEHSLITQPPLLAIAARLVYERSADQELLEALYPRLARHHDWFDRRRDPDGDHLVTIIHPWESWDASPRWDRLLRLDPFTHESGRQARLDLAVRVRQAGCDVSTLAQAGSFNVEPIDVNAIRAADLEALAAIAAELARPDEADRWQARAEAVQQAVASKLLTGKPHDLAGPDETPIEIESASDYVALFGGCATPQQAERLVQRLRQPDSWTPFPIPTSPTTSPHFAPEQYWRGNVWLPVNWLIYTGLRRYGYQDLARDLAGRSLRLVEENGFWEYYHPTTGQGYGAASQSWSALPLDMLATEQNRGR
jgi:glycogen debranching enzyme